MERVAFSRILRRPLQALLLCSLAIACIKADTTNGTSSCNSYLVSGPDLAHFQHYHFSDFRSIKSVGGNNFTTAPHLITPAQDRGGQALTSGFFNHTTWTRYWSINNGIRDSNSLIPEINSAQNVFIARNSTSNAETETYLTLRASRLGLFSSTAEIELKMDQLVYASLRTRLRVLPNGLSDISAPTAGPAEFLTDMDTGSNESHPVDVGAVLGLFFYHNDTQESDVEILTRDPIDQIHYTNQPDYNASAREGIIGASTDFTLPHNHVVTEWVDHRIDWFDGVSRWYVNGELVLNKTKNVPTSPCAVFMNLWNNGQQWSGNMSVGAQVYVGVQWVELAYNTSHSNSGYGDSRSLEPGRVQELDSSSDSRQAGSCCIDDIDFNKRTGNPYTVSTSAALSSTSYRVNKMFTVLIALICSFFFTI